jgi:hypothetical protein
MVSHAIKAGVWTVAYLGAIAIDERTVVPLGTMAFILSGVWWLGRKLQSLEDGLDEVRRRCLASNESRIDERKTN